VPVVGAREPCPCGSGKRYKACHGKAGADDRRLVTRPFEGLADEVEWVALREIVPAAVSPLKVTSVPDRTVVVSTVLPMAWPAMVRTDGTVFLGLQVQSRSGDASRDLAAALELALEAAPGFPVQPPGLPGPGPRLQDLVTGELDITLHDGFGYWLEDGASADPDVAASMERANASVIPTARLSAVPGAYWCRMSERCHLRWVLPEEEERALDALARLAAGGRSGGAGLAIGPETRYVGSFRAHGLLCPVWDLPLDREADALEEPVAALRAALDEVLADPRPLTADERRTRSGLLSRQLTLR
jgi:hypothetical protein